MLRAFIALTFLVWSSSGTAVSQSSSLANTQTVCNIAWHGCRQVPVVESAINTGSALTHASMSVFPSGPAVPPPPPDKAEQAQKLLAALAKNPFDTVAQDKARVIVKSCETSKNVIEMYTCTGFLVTPQVRLQCLKLGACLPMDFTPTVMNAPKEWQRWFTAYSDKGPETAVAFARPWTASRKQAENCRANSKNADGSVNERSFTMCMVDGMGGAEAAKARSCYAKNASSPTQFGPCLFDTKLSAVELKAANCLQEQPGKKADCLKGISDPTTAKVLDCLDLAKSDVSIFGKCVQGTRVGLDNPEVAKVKACANAAATTGGAAKDYAPLLKCAVGAGAGADLINAYERNKQLVDCGTKNTSKPLEAANCLKTAGIKLPKEVEIASCLSKAKGELAILSCSGAKLPKEIEIANRCKVASGEDTSKLALCVAGNLGLTDEQQRYLTCAQSGSLGGAAACMAAPYGSKDFGLAMQCVAETGGNPAGTALCMAGPNMNAELRIAAECAASTGGEPVSFASCAGGRLALKELQSCISGNWKAEEGCFGENNTIVRFYADLEKTGREILKAAGLETAYDNMLNDIKSGKLGKNNEIVRVFDALNAVVTMTPEQAAARIADDAARVGKQVTVGVAKLAEESRKVQKQVETLIAAAAPGVPSVSIGNGQVSVSAGPVGAQVNNRGAEVKAPGIRIEVKFRI